MLSSGMASLAYSAHPEASSLLFWVFLDVSPVWPEADSFLCSTHCRCLFCGLPKVSEFKHFNYNFNYGNLFCYFPSLIVADGGGWRVFFVSLFLIELLRGFGWYPGIFKPNDSLVDISNSDGFRGEKHFSFPPPECLEQSDVKMVQLPASFLWEVLR